MKCIICGTECKGKTCSGSCRAKLSRAHAKEAHAVTRTDKAHAIASHARKSNKPEHESRTEHKPEQYDYPYKTFEMAKKEFDDFNRKHDDMILRAVEDSGKKHKPNPEFAGLTAAAVQGIMEDTIVSGKMIKVEGEGDIAVTLLPNVRSLSRDDLYWAIDSYPRDEWIGSPEHGELMRRLHERKEEELEGYFIPVWKVA